MEEELTRECLRCPKEGHMDLKLDEDQAEALRDSLLRRTGLLHADEVDSDIQPDNSDENEQEEEQS